MKKMNAKLSTERIEELFKILKGRFEKNQNRHKDLQWEKIQERLESEPNKLWSINEMERTGGEPDVVSYEPKTGEYVFYDCSNESPQGRRSICYDRQARSSLIKD
jgi:hypothetical protein